MEQLGQFIQKHWSLWLAMVVILILIFINELVSQKKKAKELSTQDAIDLINNENAVVVDLRDKESFKSGHIIDAINAKVEDFDQQKMNKYKNKTLILVCARGLQAGSAATQLKSQGYQALVLAGGMAAWQTDDLPVVKGKI